MLLRSDSVPEELRPYEQSKGHYSFPIDGDILRRLMRVDPDIEISSHLEESLKIRKRIQDMEMEIASLEDCGGDPRLLPFQRVAALWLYTVKRGILADEQGQGKTVMALAAAAMARPRKALIVCPNSKIGDWFSHISEWIPEARQVRFDGSADDRGSAIEDWNANGGYLATNFVRVGMENLRPDLIIVDEAHKSRNRKANVFDHVRRASRSAEYAFLLTATPTVNDSSDIWTLLNIVDPKRFGSFWGFAFRFFNIDDTGFGLLVKGVKESEEENLEMVMRPYILRRTGMLGLRRSEERVVEFHLEGDQERLYREMRDTGVCAYNGEILDVMDPLALITRLRQLALNPRLIFPDYSGPSKLDALPGLIREHDDQVIVFTSYAKLAHLASAMLNREGILSAPITGDMYPDERSESIGAFRQGIVRALVLTHGTGGEGLDLTEARRAIFLDMAWHPAGNEQAARRILRYGQKSEHTEIIFVHSSGTIEDHIREIVMDKETVTIRALLKKSGIQIRNTSDST
jgi:SNF2 family DNA or RNA helicase